MFIPSVNSSWYVVAAAACRRRRCLFYGNCVAYFIWRCDQEHVPVGGGRGSVRVTIADREILCLPSLEPLHLASMEQEQQ